MGASAAASGNNENNYDPYEVLGLERDASMEEIKMAYKDLAIANHPDRNRGDKEKTMRFKAICIAYEILSDPKKRQEYNQNYSATHLNMRETSIKTIADQEKTHKKDRKRMKQEYGYGETFDQTKFNKQFEEKRVKDPNDRGYGDKMAPRLREEDVKGGMRRDEVDGPAQIFKQGEAFDPVAFNKIFEHFKQQEQDESSLMEYEDPMSFTFASSTPFTEISVYNGAMIVGDEVDDYTSFGNSTRQRGLDYIDYERGFRGPSNPTITQKEMDQIKQNINWVGKDSALSESDMNRKLREYQDTRSRQVVPEVTGGSKKAFVEAGMKLDEEKRRETKRELKKQKKLVLKYKEQYPQELLDDLNINKKKSKKDTPYEPVDKMNRTYEDLMRERM